jgi:pimeloyl-ACP methyl ester carboxylesterase
VCAGLPEEDAAEVEWLLSAVERATTYEEYLSFKERLDGFPILASLDELGLNMRTRPRGEWHLPDLEGDSHWNPIEVIERTKIPVLALFGERDTQVDPVRGARAYREALERAGNRSFRVELIPGVDHNLILSKTGCLEERRRRTARGWQRYPPQYLDLVELWLRELEP